MGAKKYLRRYPRSLWHRQTIEFLKTCCILRLLENIDTFDKFARKSHILSKENIVCF